MIDTLSAATTSLPYTTALPLLTSLTRAAGLAASSPPSPSPFSLLPNELIARVVHFCQDDDFRLRQNTNLALASTCRAFNCAAQPILSRKRTSSPPVSSCASPTRSKDRRRPLRRSGA